MAATSESESEEIYSGLRYKWLNTLKKEELKILCQNRDIDTDLSTKKALIKSLLKSKPLKEYDRLKKQSLSLELKAKGIKDSETMSKTQLIKTLNDNKTVKPTYDTLSKLNLSELTKLCQRRQIQIKDYSSKQSLIDLLQSTDAPDPEYTESMTSKRLSAEMKGRGFSVSGLIKDGMLKILQSGISLEEQKLNSHINHQNVDQLIENTKNALQDFINYIKENSEQIQKFTKKETKKAGNKKKAKSRDYLSSTEWSEIEDTLRTTRDEIIDIRTMIESYCDIDLGQDEVLPKYKNFKNVIDYDIDSEIDEKDGGDIVYVVYDCDTELILDQDKKTVLAVFQNENEAEEYKKKLMNDDKDIEVGIQEIKVNDYWGADPETHD